MLGVPADGRKELVAITDGYRESCESWADLLRDCKTPRHDRPSAGRRRWRARVLEGGAGGIPEDPSSAAGSDKQANVLAGLPKSAHPAALAAIKDIYNAEDIDKAQVAVKAFAVAFGAKYPKVVAKIVDDLDVLLEFYHYPAEHWIHLRTTESGSNPPSPQCV